MSRYLWGLLAGGVLVSGAGLGFALTLIYTAARERRAALKRGTLAEAPAHQTIAEAGIERQTRRLAAELDDPAKVDAWLAGGAR